MLYTGLLVFRGILSAQLYDNYLMLFAGIRILTSTELVAVYCDYAQQLLITCVKNMRELYGRGMMVYSVHGLLHLTDDGRRYGVLDNFLFSQLKIS
jgi:hypothetical protein